MLPAIPIVGWAVNTKTRTHKLFEAWGIGFAAVAVILYAVIFIPGETGTLDASQMRPFAIQIAGGGNIAFSIYTGDFIVVAQALPTMMRMVPMRRTMRRYGLQVLSFRPKVSRGLMCMQEATKMQHQPLPLQ